ncbi:MAG: hypothetical protein IJ213_09170 [Bacteroidales bacterium]|nr:hypothetical protein [Bacteroidales bacterium]
MKTIKATFLLLFIAVFTGLTFVSCSEDEDDRVSTWVSKVNGTRSITMKLYEKERKFYTTTIGEDDYRICFMNDTWWEYKYLNKKEI